MTEAKLCSKLLKGTNYSSPNGNQLQTFQISCNNVCGDKNGVKFVNIFPWKKRKVTLLSTREVTLPSALLCPSACWFPGLLTPTIAFDFVLLVCCASAAFCALFSSFGPRTSLARPFKSWPWSPCFSLFYFYLIWKSKVVFFGSAEFHIRRPLSLISYQKFGRVAWFWSRLHQMPARMTLLKVILAWLTNWHISF